MVFFKDQFNMYHPQTSTMNTLVKVKKEETMWKDR